MATKKTNLLPSPHAEAAKAYIEKIRALRAEFPRLVTDGVAISRRMNALAVPDEFMESVSVGVETSPRLAEAGGIDAATLRDAYAHAIAYGPVVQEVLAFARFVAHSIRLDRAEAAAIALDVYAVAQRISKQKGGAELIPLVEDMRKKLHKKRTRRTNSDPVPAPAPVTAPPVRS